MDRRIRVENQGYAVYKITRKYKQQVLSIWVHATIEEKFRRVAYKIVLQIRHARKELVERVTTHLRDSWHRRYALYFVDRWRRFVGYIYMHASRIARFFQSLRSRRLGKKLRKHLRVLRRALQPVINRHFFRRFAQGDPPTLVSLIYAPSLTSHPNPPSHHITSHHITPHHITSHHITSPHSFIFRIYTLPLIRHHNTWSFRVRVAASRAISAAVDADSETVFDIGFFLSLAQGHSRSTPRSRLHVAKTTATE